MFTWECPSCGKELDVDAQQCPKCGAQFGEAEESASIIADPKPSTAPAPPPAAPTTPPAPVRTQAPAATAPPPAAPATLPPPVAAPAFQERPAHAAVQEQNTPAPAIPPAANGIQGKHLAIVLVVLLVAVTAAVYLARPDLFQGRQDIALEDVPLSDTVGFASAAFGDLQVAGVRPFYTDDLKTKVRFVVINHGETPQAGASIQAHLSHKEAPLDSPPLASFVIAFNATLAPGESREIETDLMALSTLAAFPPWKDLRIDLDVE